MSNVVSTKVSNHTAKGQDYTTIEVGFADGNIISVMVPGDYAPDQISVDVDEVSGGIQVHASVDGQMIAFAKVEV